MFVDPPGITKTVLRSTATIRVPAGLAVDKQYLCHEEHDGVAVESPEVVLRFPWKDAIRKERVTRLSLY